MAPVREVAARQEAMVEARSEGAVTAVATAGNTVVMAAATGVARKEVRRAEAARVEASWGWAMMERVAARVEASWG